MSVTQTADECQHWDLFRAQLEPEAYTCVQILGSLGKGQTSCDPIGVTTLATALRDSTTTSVLINGVVWRTGLCGSGIELSAGTPDDCDCTAFPTVRPCIGNNNWGGIGDSCGAASQTLEVNFRQAPGRATSPKLAIGGSPTMLLEDKVAIVTGIGPGLGRDVALLFARQGAQLVIGARNAERLEVVAAEARAHGRDVLAVPTDITDRAACQRLVSAALERHGRVDILVQNGHYDGDYKIVSESDPQDWRDIMEVNLFGAFHLVQAVAPSMKQHGEGRIILMNTGASTDPPPTLGAYAASKAALASLVRTIAVELGPDGIRANGIQLGPMTGENFTGYLEDQARANDRTFDEELELWNQQFALRYTPTTEECAGTALFLASDLARPITGQSIAVNGGRWFVA